MAKFCHNNTRTCFPSKNWSRHFQLEYLKFQVFKGLKSTYNLICLTSRSKSPFNSVEIFRSFAFEQRIFGSLYFHLGQPGNKKGIGQLCCP